MIVELKNHNLVAVWAFDFEHLVILIFLFIFIVGAAYILVVRIVVTANFFWGAYHSRGYMLAKDAASYRACVSI